MGAELTCFGHKKSVRDQLFFIVLIFILSSIAFCQGNRINKFVFLQWVRTNRQTKNNKKQVKICNLIYLKALIGKNNELTKKIPICQHKRVDDDESVL